MHTSSVNPIYVTAMSYHCSIMPSPGQWGSAVSLEQLQMTAAKEKEEREKREKMEAERLEKLKKSLIEDKTRQLYLDKELL